MKCLFEGSGTALSTPFTENGVNQSVFKQLIEFQVKNGCDAAIVCGTTGEPSTMTAQEKQTAIEVCVDTVNGRVPVVAGTGGNHTTKVIEDSLIAQKIGADALLVVTPYYNRCTQKGLIAHYSALADAVALPIIAYNVPSRTGVNMLPETMAALAEHPNIYGTKEASGNISQITKLCALCADKIAIYSGNDDHIVPMLSVGAVGVISVMGNIIPQVMHDMVALYKRGDIQGSRALQLGALELCAALFCEVNPIPIKMALTLMGFNMGSPRLPLTPLESGHVDYLKQAMVNYGLTLA
ncbi:MAG: 4-hydroxy-tetrahydrodipicolinate synthase [Christensenellales bacterium]|jgi:4-hydroxy-tetrahydrodipicolinate synthase